MVTKVVGTAGDGKCFVCMNPLPEGAAVCTECESLQLTKRFTALLARLAFVLVLPVIAWFIAAWYQHGEHARETAQSTISRVVDQTSQVLEMNDAFQVAFDTLPTNCSKEAQSAANLCLAEYVDRIIRLNELTSKFSWKADTLPLPEEAVSSLRKWQDSWWGGTGGSLKRTLAEMAKSGKLLECQKLDFTDSECGGEVQKIMGPFRDKTLLAMATVSVELKKRLLSLYESLPRNSSTKALEDQIRDNLPGSWAYKFVQASRVPAAAGR